MIYFIVLEPKSTYDNPLYKQGILKGLVATVKAAAGQDVEAVHYLELNEAWMKTHAPAALVLSGNSAEWKVYPPGDFVDLQTIIRTTRVPILGVCGGHQLIGMTYGKYPVEVAIGGVKNFEEDETPIDVLVKSDPLFNGLSAPEMMEHHHQMVPETPPGFIHLAETKACRIQAMKHSERILYGTQFHPEQDDLAHSDGKRLLENFFVLSAVRKRLLTNELYSSSEWRRTLQYFVTFQLDGEPHYLSYREEPGVGDPSVMRGRLRCDRIAPDGAKARVENLFEETWDQGWTVFAVFEMNLPSIGRTPSYLAYASNGFVSMGTIDKSGTHELYNDDGWRRTWQRFITFELDGDPYYLSYGEQPDPTNPSLKRGHVKCARIRVEAGKGKVDPVFEEVWDPGWTAFSALRPGLVSAKTSTPGYLAYGSAGFASIGTIDKKGTHELYNDAGWRRTWLHFATYEHAGEPHYLSYGEERDARDPGVIRGRLLCARVAPDGTQVKVDTLFEETWAPGWTALVAFQLPLTATVLKPCYLAYSTNGHASVGTVGP